MTTAVIITGGAPVPSGVLDDLPEMRWVVAADSGADNALAIGLGVDVIVGDLDSVADATIAAYPDATVLSHPRDKNFTDLDLAISLVSDRNDVDRLLVVGGTGGRLDHFLSNAMVLAAPRFNHLHIEWIAPPARLAIVHDHIRLHGTAGDHLSLIPVGGDVVGVVTTGLRWPLQGEPLGFGSSRGVSNEFVTAVATVAIESGVLLAVQPNA